MCKEQFTLEEVKLRHGGHPGQDTVNVREMLLYLGVIHVFFGFLLLIPAMGTKLTELSLVRQLLLDGLSLIIVGLYAALLVVSVRSCILTRKDREAWTDLRVVKEKLQQIKPAICYLSGKGRSRIKDERLCFSRGEFEFHLGLHYAFSENYAASKALCPA